MDIQYDKEDEIDRVLVNFDISHDNDDVDGGGNFFISQEKYREGIGKLQEVAKEHMKEKIRSKNFKIKNTNMVYDKKEIKEVNIIFQVKDDERTIKITGNFEIDGEKYLENSDLNSLIEMSKDFICGEIDNS